VKPSPRVPSDDTRWPGIAVPPGPRSISAARTGPPEPVARGRWRQRRDRLVGPRRGSRTVLGTTIGPLPGSALAWDTSAGTAPPPPIVRRHARLGAGRLARIGPPHDHARRRDRCDGGRHR
jgi:hypothetical protein